MSKIHIKGVSRKKVSRHAYVSRAIVYTQKRTQGTTMRQQATKANDAQIRQHIERQRIGIPGMEFAQNHPIIDAVAGGLILALFFGAAITGWIAIGSGVTL